MRRLLLALALAITSPAVAAAAPGLTVEAGAGVAGGLALNEVHLSTGAGASALHVGVGWFATPRTGIGARLATHVLFGGNDVRTTTGFIGLAVQHWLDDRAYAGVGTGIAFLDADRTTDFADDLDYRDALMVGYGLELRLGHALFAARRVTFSLEGQWLIGRYDNGDSLPTTSTSLAFQLGARWR
jgi:hypothetical protein